MIEQKKQFKQYELKNSEHKTAVPKAKQIF